MTQIRQDRRRQGSKIALMPAALLAVVAALWWFRWHPDAATSQARTAPEAPAGRREPPPAPVYAAKAKSANLPIILRGIGTVTAYNTVAAE
jgi:multidrug efflux pump subunit AcrA (membrane-fusion protein)